MPPTFLATPEALRAWLAKHHRSATELLLGLEKRAAGSASLTWKLAVDEALCFGWIDGIRKRVDEDRYVIRFTPRKPTSIWSAATRAMLTALHLLPGRRGVKRTV